MKKYLGIVISLLIILVSLLYVKVLKERDVPSFIENNIGNFTSQRSCAKHPNFLKKLKVQQPIAIDLSQKEHKGLAFLYGQGLRKVVHLKTWEQFDYFSTYALDSMGNMFLTPMPFISVREKTFEFQKNIYRLDTNSGKLSTWMTLEDVNAGANNPFGVIALAYDCDDNTLWISAIDETDYLENNGVLYHIDIKSKKIIERIEGIDALSLKLVNGAKGKILLFGGARENKLYALSIKNLQVIELFTLPNTHEHIRKIKIRGKNLLELQTIPFSYTLIAANFEGNERKLYSLGWEEDSTTWKLLTK